MSNDEKPSASDWERIARARGITPQAVLKFKKQNKRRGLTSKQVERALVANKRDKLKSICHRVATTGHAHLYLSVAGDKVVLTGVAQLKATPRPFNKRGFGSAKHPLKPQEAAAKKIKPKPYLSRLSPEQRRELSRRGGLAAAKKRADKAARLKARGPHWTQLPQHREKVLAIHKKMLAARSAKNGVGA